MNMPKVTLLTVVVGLLSALGPTALAQETPTFAGNLCNPTTHADAERIQYSPQGVRNNSTSVSVNVTCGSSFLNAGAYGISQAIAIVYDRNLGPNVCCTFSAQDGFGATVWSATQCSTGSSSSVQILLADAPDVAFVNATAQCSIPTQTGSGISSVFLYGFETIE